MYLRATLRIIYNLFEFLTPTFQRIILLFNIKYDLNIKICYTNLTNILIVPKSHYIQHKMLIGI